MDDQEAKPIVFADLETSRDLWPGIEARLDAADNDIRKVPWMGRAAGIAASLVLAITVTLFWQGGANPNGIDSPSLSVIKQRAVAMQQDHETQMAPLLAEVVPADYQSALSALNTAEAEIFAALDANAQNPALLRLLAKLYHRRAGLLMKTQQAGSYS